jgi:hypothetical protein
MGQTAVLAVAAAVLMPLAAVQAAQATLLRLAHHKEVMAVMDQLMQPLIVMAAGVAEPLMLGLLQRVAAAVMVVLEPHRLYLDHPLLMPVAVAAEQEAQAALAAAEMLVQHREVMA